MIRKGLWSPDEDEKLRRSIAKYVNGSWSDIARKAGLQRCGRSCRQRWLNHLRPGLRKDKFSKDEMKQVMDLQAKLGNRWSEIAAQMSGRTDNEVKNLWNTLIKRRRLSSPSPSHDTLSSPSASSSRSSWSLHACSPGPADVDFCSPALPFELSAEQLFMINGGHNPSQAPSINGQNELHVDQQAASALISPSFEFISVAHDQALLIPPLSPCPDPPWDSSAKLDEYANLLHPPTLPFTNHNFIGSNSHPSKTSPHSLTSDCHMFPSFQSRECATLLSKALEPPPPTIESSPHCLTSSLLPQQFMSMDDNESSHNHAPTLYPRIIRHHEDRSYAFNLDKSHDIWDGLDSTPSTFETSFHPHAEHGLQDILTSFLWSGDCHE